MQGDKSNTYVMFSLITVTFGLSGNYFNSGTKSWHREQPSRCCWPMFSSQLLGAPMLSAQADAFLAAMHPIAAMSMNVTPQCSRFFSSYGDFTFHFFDCISLCMPNGFLQPSLPLHLDASPKEEDSLMVPFFIFFTTLFEQKLIPMQCCNHQLTQKFDHFCYSGFVVTGCCDWSWQCERQSRHSLVPRHAAYNRNGKVPRWRFDSVGLNHSFLHFFNLLCDDPVLCLCIISWRRMNHSACVEPTSEISKYVRFSSNIFIVDHGRLSPDYSERNIHCCCCRTASLMMCCVKLTTSPRRRTEWDIQI